MSSTLSARRSRCWFELAIVLIVVVAFCVQADADTNCFLVKQHDEAPFVYAPGYGPDKSHSVFAHHSTANEIIAQKERWCYEDELDGVKTGYRIGVDCGMYCSCKGRRCGGCSHGWYVWMSVPIDAIHPSKERELEYEYPGHVIRRDIEALWDRFQDSDRRQFLLPESPAQPTARSQLSDWYVRVSPKNFEGLLRYHFGFSDGNIDITPGMRLRVQSSLWSSPRRLPESHAGDGAGSEDGRAELEVGQFDGYVNTGTSFIDVVRLRRDGHEIVGFDSYLGALNLFHERPRTGPEYKANLIGGAADLNPRGHNNLRQYWRLRYPRDLEARDEIKQGPKFYVLFIGAEHASELTDTNLARLAATPNWKIPRDDEPFLIYGFRGRSIVVPQVAIESNSEFAFADVGTTLRHKIDRHGTFHRRSDKVELRRLFQGQLHTVRFHDPDDPDLYDLPLLKGDSVRW